MRRARVIGTLLVLILLGCGVAIFLDQQGAFGAGQTVQGTPAPVRTDTATPAATDPGYGELR